MQVKTKSSMKVQVTLAENEADRLNQLSKRRGVSASDLIAKVIQDFINDEMKDEVRDWSAMSLAAFEKDWDNDEDAIYDNWRELYEVQSG